MLVDVSTSIDISAPREVVSAFAGDRSGGGTLMTLRNQGEPTGFAGIAAPLMVAAMRRANRKDLGRLKEILEDGVGG